MIKVKLVKSLICCTPVQRRTVAAMGLKKIRQVRELPDNPCSWGMIRRAHKLVEVVK